MKGKKGERAKLSDRNVQTHSVSTSGHNDGKRYASDDSGSANATGALDDSADSTP
jgi:hypothetical protein